MKQKGLRKLVSMILAVAMVLSMSVAAFAADSTQYTITIDNSIEGYTYVAYQIFAGDLNIQTTENADESTTTTKVLSNITWGSDVNTSAEGFENALTNKYGTTDARTIAESIANEDDAAAFAEIIANYLTGGTTFAYNENYTISVTGAGYYLVKNTDVPSGNYGYSDYIMEVVADVTANPKNTETPTLDKTVGTESDGDLGDTDDATEDYAVGDSVPFTLTATLASSYNAYDTYKLVFHDTLSSGLTYNENSLTVTIGTTTLNDDDYDLKVAGKVITVTIADLMAIDNLTLSGGEKIVVSYTATLNTGAESVEYNSAYLEYSNNPNGESTGTTPADKTYVVTFDVTVNKIDGSENRLKGAGFTLYKYDEVSETYETTGKVLTVNESDTDNNDSVDDAGTVFTVGGLAIGKYKLVETTTPAGYNTADDIEFSITAEAVENNDTNGVTVTSNVNNTGVTISSTAVTTTVVNNAGSTLPSTGGTGTTIFYIIGGVLVISAAVLLITKKRLGNAK